MRILSFCFLALGALSVSAQSDMAMEELIHRSLAEIAEVNLELEEERERRWGAFREALPGARIEQLQLSGLFGEAESTLLLYEESSRRLAVHHPERARERFLPCSTFKIPHALIALETGVASGPEHFIAWDSAAFPPEGWWPESWRRDHSLRSAVPHSVVWYFRSMAREIGPERMQAWLDRLDYGNQSILPAVDGFWLEGDLRISALEQILFLRRLYHGRLPASDEAQATVRELIRLETRDGRRFSGKTGSGRGEDGEELAWIVGYVEGPGEALTFFALNLEGEGVWDRWPGGRRLELVRELIEKLRL